MLMLFCLTAWRGGEIWTVARFGVHKVNYCSTRRFVFGVFISIFIVMCSALAFHSAWNTIMVLLYFSTIFTQSGDDYDGVDDYDSNIDGWWCCFVFTLTPSPYPTVPGRGCQSSCALHQERSAFIAKGLWVSHSLLLWKQRAVRRLQLNPGHSRVLSLVKSQTDTQSTLPLHRLLFWYSSNLPIIPSVIHVL